METPSFRDRGFALHVRPAAAGAVLVRVVVMGLVATNLAACVMRDPEPYLQREERRFSIKGTPDVRLATFDGSVVIRGWDRDEVSVEIEKRGRDEAAVQAIEIVTDQKGNAVSVDVREKGGAGKRSYGLDVLHAMSRSARLVVSVPSGSNLTVRTGDGAIRVEHISGNLELRSADGSVTGRDLSGDVFAHTEDGRIKFEGVDGKCDLASDDGSIEVQGRLDGLRVRTEDGSVIVKALAGSKITRDWSLTTGDGSMVIYVTDALAGEVDAEAHDGSVRFDSSLAFARTTGGGGERNVLRGRLGIGGQRLTLRSGDGSIRLRRLPGDAPPPPEPPRPPRPPVPPDIPVER